MRPTMRFDHTSSGIFLLVHSLEAPSAEEWKAHVVAMEQGIQRIRGVMVVSGGGAAVPNAGQRHMVAGMFARQSRHPKVAVLTVSAVERHVITAFSWIMRNPIRGFAANQAAQAFDYLEVAAIARSDVLDRAVEWAKELGNPSLLVL